MGSPYAPPGESAAELFAEKGWLQGAIVGGVAYGVDFTLFCMCFRLLYKHSVCSRKLKNVLLIFSSVIFILSTLFMISLASFTQMAFIDNRNFPGGPGAYEDAMFSQPVSELGNISFVLANWISDLMMMWRCYTIYRGSDIPSWLTMIFPGMILAASFATGILWLMQISTTSPYGAAASVNWTSPFLSISLALNIVLTIMIVARLLFQRHRLKQVLGRGYGVQYTTLAAVVVESSAIYSAYSLLFLVLFGLKNSISTVFLQSLSQVQTAASLLIIVRVAKGEGVNTEAVRYTVSGISAVSTRIRFRDRRNSTAIPMSLLDVVNTTTEESSDSAERHAPKTVEEIERASNRV